MNVWLGTGAGVCVCVGEGEAMIMIGVAAGLASAMLVSPAASSARGCPITRLQY